MVAIKGHQVVGEIWVGRWGCWVGECGLFLVRGIGVFEVDFFLVHIWQYRCATSRCYPTCGPSNCGSPLCFKAPNDVSRKKIQCLFQEAKHFAMLNGESKQCLWQIKGFQTHRNTDELPSTQKQSHQDYSLFRIGNPNLNLHL